MRYGSASACRPTRRSAVTPADLTRECRDPNSTGEPVRGALDEGCHGRFGAQVLHYDIAVARGSPSEPLRGEQPPLDGDAVREAGRGPVAAVEQHLDVRGRARAQHPGQQLLGESASGTAADPQDQRGVRGKQGRGRLGQECAGPFTYRLRPVRAADDDERKQRGPLLGVVQRRLADPAFGVAEGKGEFGVTGLPAPDDSGQRRAPVPAQPPPGRRRVGVEQLRPLPGQLAYPEVEADPGFRVRHIERLARSNSGGQLPDGLVRLVFAGQHW
ncbi:hypothetical protein [Streptomyces sp. L-9-10]|uniref:hypothetical protein n=1 Tax=Streptomyces sp. L-9-10 TaxID=1478131 RepID=UPI00101D8914|nr:hypothetical protein [Streptomyces sp. L-9-10]